MHAFCWLNTAFLLSHLVPFPIGDVALLGLSAADESAVFTERRSFEEPGSRNPALPCSAAAAGLSIPPQCGFSEG